MSTEDPIVVRWNGRSWKQTSSVVDGCVHTDSFDAVAANGRLVLAITRCEVEKTGRWASTVVEHRPGRGWIHVRFPEALREAWLTDVTFAGRDAWVVGEAGRAVTVHRVGRRWTDHPSGIVGQLHSVTATADGVLWAVGQTYSGHRLAMQWDGASWHEVESAGKGWFQSIALLGDGTPYATIAGTPRSALARYG